MHLLYKGTESNIQISAIGGHTFLSVYYFNICLRPCVTKLSKLYIRDEGESPLGIGLHGLISNHLELLYSQGYGGERQGQVWAEKVNESEPRIKRRK